MNEKKDKEQIKQSAVKAELVLKIGLLSNRIVNSCRIAYSMIAMLRDTEFAPDLIAIKNQVDDSLNFITGFGTPQDSYGASAIGDKKQHLDKLELIWSDVRKQVNKLDQYWLTLRLSV